MHHSKLAFLLAATLTLLAVRPAIAQIQRAKEELRSGPTWRDWPSVILLALQSSRMERGSIRHGHSVPLIQLG